MTDTSLFTTTEARAHDKLQLADSSKITAAQITAAEARIRADFERICGVAFFPTSCTEILDGVYSESIRVSRANPALEVPRRPIQVTAGSIDGTALTVAELADLACYPSGKVVRKTLGYWYGDSPNLGNISLTYTHGWASVPAEIKLAALTLAAYQLVPSNLSDRATSWSDGVATYSMAYAGQAPHWFGIPFVDGVVDRYRENRAAVV